VDTIILLTDIYGPDYVNTQLVADEWSKQGWRVVIPDLFVGDPVPIEDIRVRSNLVLASCANTTGDPSKEEGSGFKIGS
jgi:dienelactone hydrolase